MSQRIETLDWGSEAEVSDLDSILEPEKDRAIPQKGELRPLARALVELAMSIIEEAESDR